MAPERSWRIPAAFLLILISFSAASTLSPTQTAVHESTLLPPSRVTPGPGSKSLSTVPLLRGRNTVHQQYCGCISGEHGGDADEPLKCSLSQSFCALIQTDVVGCCGPEARIVGSVACEYFTTCYARSVAKYLQSKDDRAQTCTYTAETTITTLKTTLDLAELTLSTFPTTVVITKTESECVKWVFQIDGTKLATTWGCATVDWTLNVVTSIESDRLTAGLSTLFQDFPGTALTTTTLPPDTTPTPISTSLPSSPSSPASESKNVQIIIGVVIGGIAGIGLLAGFGWWWSKRQKEKGWSPSSSNTSTPDPRLINSHVRELSDLTIIPPAPRYEPVRAYYNS